MSAPRQPSGYALPVYEPARPADLKAAASKRYAVVIVGAGLTGLTAACDFSLRGIPALVLDDDNTVGVRGASSRGMVYVQKSLEVFHRLGVYDRIAAKGVRWSVGRTLAGNDIVYEFDAAAATPSVQAPFINLQQFYVEWYLVDRLRELGGADLRWKNKVTGVVVRPDHVVLEVETPFGGYSLEADWVIDASGANSLVRDALGLETHPDLAKDQWCICDVRFKKALPKERWTWVSAPFNGERAVWQHPMADDVWRLDYQMGETGDAEEASRLDLAAERVRRHLGADAEFEMVWIGPWHYRTHLLDDFRHGRVFFVGDAAHVVSPFGARGGNSGIADVDNLVWKLAMVMRGLAERSLLDSYNKERRAAARENILVTRRTSRFLAPASPQERVLRDAAVSLAREHRFGRSLVNTGRLAVASRYADLPDSGSAGVPVANVRLQTAAGPSCLANLVRESGDRLLAFVRSDDERDLAGLADLERTLAVKGFLLANACSDSRNRLSDKDCLLSGQLGLAPGEAAVVRPDLYMAGKVNSPTPAKLRELVERVLH